MTATPSSSPAADGVTAAIAVLSDSDQVLKVIQYLLAGDYLLTGVWVNGATPRPPIPPGGFALPDLDSFGMVIVAAVQPETEPLVLLGQAGLGCLVGQVPILLITERQFRVTPTSRIVGLTYPFTPEELRRAVQAVCPIQA